jgi:tRNA(Met) C34 N-acetyltransferase TmcA
MIQKLLQIVYSDDEVNEIVKIFHLNLSLRYLKNDNLESRLNGAFELSFCC